jgi:Tol biopolymer transport system component
MVRRVQPAILSVALLASLVMGFVGLLRVFPVRWPGPASTPVSQLVFVVAASPSPGSGVTTSIYRVEADGSNLRDISPDNGYYLSPTWSPDGQSLAVVRFQGLKEGIFRLDLKTTALTELRRTGDPEPISVWQLEWSPVGDQLGYVYARYIGSSEADFPMQLYVMRPDGTNARALTDEIDGQVTSFSWAPDGSQIALSRQTLAPDGRQLVSDIFLMDSDGGDVRRLTEDGVSTNPAWSPSGDRIAFESRQADEPLTQTSIYVMKPDGTGRQRLTNLPGSESAPVWSPDGQLLAFTRFGGGAACTLNVMRSDGSDQLAIVAEDDVGGCPSDPAWSPVGEAPSHPEPTHAPTPGESQSPVPGRPRLWLRPEIEAVANCTHPEPTY